MKDSASLRTPNTFASLSVNSVRGEAISSLGACFVALTLSALLAMTAITPLCYASNEASMNFKSGNDLYRKKQYDEAIRSYEKSLLSANKAVEAALNYNIGNCKFRQGKTKESSDLAGAIAQYRSSLDYYKRAMELAPQDKDAKFNHEFVERLLKTLIDKMKKQQQQKSGQQAKEGQQSKDQKQQQQQEQQKEQQTNQAQQQQAQSGQAQQQKQQEKGQKSQEIEKVGGDITSAGKELDKEMSREEAGVLLDDYRQREQQDRQLSDKHKPQRYPDVEKDW